MENNDRGHSIKLVLTMTVHNMLKFEDQHDAAVENLRKLAINGFFKQAEYILKELGHEILSSNRCYICNNVFNKIDEYVDSILQATKEYEFNTFVIGTKVPAIYIEREDAIRSQFNINTGESLKAELNRLLGRKLQSLTNKKVSFNNPEIVIVVDIANNNVSIEPKPLFIHGRYRKLIKGIPQTPWFCSNCWTRGCSKCNYTGKLYETSISELIINPIINIVGGIEGIFHGAGREDIDTLTLGSGRPFIVEIKKPKFRYIDLKTLEKMINENACGKIEVELTHFSDRKEVRKLKSSSTYARKVYQAIIEVDNKIDENILKKLEEFFSNKEVKQFTPLRVLHRRANKLRIKKIFSVKTELINEQTFKATIECQGGLYIKELISGDNNRTIPNFSQILSSNARCLDLSVIFVSEH